MTTTTKPANASTTTQRQLPVSNASQAAANLDARRVERARDTAIRWVNEAPLRPTLEQVRAIAAGIRKGLPLEDTAATLDLPEGTDAYNFVLDVVSTYGTWLAHSNGAAEASIDWDTPSGHQLRLFADDGLPVVVGPEGYAPQAGHRRDVSKALAAVATAGQDAEVLNRFVTRTYSTRQGKLCYPILAGVWGFSVMNRLGTLDKVSDDPVFLSLAVEAYDLLDIARKDGVAAVEELVVTDLSDLERISHLAVRADWLAERQMRLIRTAAEHADSEPMAAAKLARELGYLQMQYASGAFPLPAGVRHLTLGQVQRISVANGIPVEARKRVEETDIRATLKEMGFATDVDMLLPDALRCAEEGVLDRFWEVMTTRASGDPSWAEDLAELFA